MTDEDGLLAAAVADNVRWVDVVARANGVATTTTASLWSAGSATPDGYPEAVTRLPGTPPEQVLTALPSRDGPWSVKDSYADVDLSPAGFEPLFRASWLVHRGPVAASDDVWSHVTDVAGLAAWRHAWDEESGAGWARAGLLDEAGVVLLLRGGAEAPTGCAVATPGGTAVGVGNVVWTDGRPGWPGLLAALARLAPGLPVVGYETGDASAAARAAGFEELGPLRVWLRPAPAPG